MLDDDHHIDFEHWVHIANDDKTKRHPVKRKNLNQEDGQLREMRFIPNPIAPISSFHDLIGFRRSFIDIFMDQFGINFVNDCDKQKQKIVKKDMTGILYEDRLVGKTIGSKVD